MEANEILPDKIDTIAMPQKRSRKRSITIFIVVTLLNVGLLVLLWAQLVTPAHKPTSFNSTSDLGDIQSPLIGKMAPDFTLSPLDGKGAGIHLASFKGQPLVLNFWASWCEGCKQEAPFLHQAVPDLQSQGAVFIGIDGQEASTDALTFLRKYGITGIDVQDTINGSTGIDYGVTGFPTTVFINQHGVIAAMWIGPLNAQGVQLEMAKAKR